MKFTIFTVLVSLSLFIASCSAACSCSSSDQVCMDKCVLAANTCIVECKDGGDACQKACISSHWPASPVSQNVVIADPSSSVGAIATPIASSGSSPSAHAPSVHVSTYSTTLSGGSATVITSTIRSSAPTGRASGSPSASGTNSTNGAGLNKMSSMVTLVTIIVTTVVWAV